MLGTTPHSSHLQGQGSRQRQPPKQPLKQPRSVSEPPPVLPSALSLEHCSLLSPLWGLADPPPQVVTFWAWAFLTAFGPSDLFEGCG